MAAPSGATSVGSNALPGGLNVLQGVVTFEVVQPGGEHPRLQLLASHKLWDLAVLVCEKVLHKLRRGDSDVYEHLWTFRAGREVKAQGGKPSVKWLKGAYEGPHADMPMCEEAVMQTERRSTKLSAPRLKLAVGSILEFAYDQGSTSVVWLRCAAVEPRSAVDATDNELPRALRPPLAPHAVPADCAAQLIAGCPAAFAPAELRLDNLFPNFARAFMDKDTYVRASLGLSNISTGEDDATFSFVEDHATDAMMAGTPFKDMDEFLSIAEKAWAVKCPPDTRAGWFSRLVAPCEMGEDAEQRWEEMQRYYKEEPMAKYGPAQRFFRFSPEEKAEAIEALRQKGFSFAKMFPKTAAQFASGRFRWVLHVDGLLRVVAGRGTGKLHRGAPPAAVLREWEPNDAISGMHELMAAVECSWVKPGSTWDTSRAELGDEALPLDLADAGPIRPKPPPWLSRAKDARVLRPKPAGQGRGSKLAEVCTVALSPTAAHAYTGHMDGHLTKWSLSGDGSHDECWSVVAHTPEADKSQDESEEDEHGRDPDSRDPFAGVWGVLVAADNKCVYTWSRSSTICAWDIGTGAPLATYNCNAASAPGEPTCGYGWENEDGSIHWRQPSVNCVTLATLEETPCLLVGLHVQVEDPDDGEADDVGNLVPIDLESGDIMEAWFGHSFGILGICVHPSDRYAITAGGDDRGLAEIILWDLDFPGSVLHFLEFGRDSRVGHSALETMCMNDDGTVVLMFDSFAGSSMALLEVDVEEEEVKLRGFMDSGIGRMHDLLQNSYSCDGRRLSIYTNAVSHGMVLDLQKLGSITPTDRNDKFRLKDGAFHDEYGSEEDSSEEDSDDGDSDVMDEDGGSDNGGRSASSKKQNACLLAGVGFVGYQKAKPKPSNKPKPRYSFMEEMDRPGTEVVAHAASGRTVVSGYGDGSVRVQSLKAEESLEADKAMHGCQSSMNTHSHGILWFGEDEGTLSAFNDLE
mmetsp:Transcript_10166/g.25883  ORF Transcript_10166/g.25883 Transcript_10166/m.25883 type:complete len:972 (-) Transcript_10166:192-3107(-)|eukprot:jgi/Tetstr1/430413/TSEL_020223.t1